MKKIKSLLEQIIPSINFEFQNDKKRTNNNNLKIETSLKGLRIDEEIIENLITDKRNVMLNNDLSYCNNDVEMNLFFWCILSNRIELAKLFWKMGKVIKNI